MTPTNSVNSNQFNNHAKSEQAFQGDNSLSKDAILHEAIKIAPTRPATFPPMTLFGKDFVKYASGSGNEQAQKPDTNAFTHTGITFKDLVGDFGKELKLAASAVGPDVPKQLFGAGSTPEPATHERKLGDVRGQVMRIIHAKKQQGHILNTHQQAEGKYILFQEAHASVSQDENIGIKGALGKIFRRFVINKPLSPHQVAGIREAKIQILKNHVRPLEPPKGKRRGMLDPKNLRTEIGPGTQAQLSTSN